MKVDTLKWAIKLSANLVFDLIFIESDSKVVVEALSKLELEIPWRILNICSGMSLLLSQFTNVSVNWVPRNSNGASIPHLGQMVS